MSPATPGPIVEDWPLPTEPSRPPATAADLAARVGEHDLTDLEPHAASLAIAVSELAHDARGRPLVDPDDPLVTQVRALGRLALRHPRSSSSAAARLLDALDDPGSGGARARAHSGSTVRYGSVVDEDEIAAGLAPAAGHRRSGRPGEIGAPVTT